MKTKSKEGLIGATVGLFILLPFIGLGAEPPKEAQSSSHKTLLPKDEKIRSVIADMYCHPFVGDPSEITHFRIPDSRVSELIRHFENCEPDNEVRESDMEIGTIRVNLERGDCFRFCWYVGRQNDRLRFTYDGRRYVHTGPRWGKDEGFAIDGFVRGLYYESQAAKEKDATKSPHQ